MDEIFLGAMNVLRAHLLERFPLWKWSDPSGERTHWIASAYRFEIDKWIGIYFNESLRGWNRLRGGDATGIEICPLKARLRFHPSNKIVVRSRTVRHIGVRRRPNLSKLFLASEELLLAQQSAAAEDEQLREGIAANERLIESEIGKPLQQILAATRGPDGKYTFSVSASGMSAEIVVLLFGSLVPTLNGHKLESLGIVPRLSRAQALLKNGD